VAKDKNWTCVGTSGEVVSSTEEPGIDITSTGGFSSKTSQVMPSYQRQAVEAYLKNAEVLPPSHLYNASRRALPDVAALSNNLILLYEESGDVAVLASGTSVASPIFTGVMAHLVSLSRQKRGAPLGFLNPLLYKMQREAPDAFNDVTEGNNRCNRNVAGNKKFHGCPSTCKYGFNATEGWDAATGLGTPNAGNMLKYLETLLESCEGRRNYQCYSTKGFCLGNHRTPCANGTSCDSSVTGYNPCT